MSLPCPSKQQMSLNISYACPFNFVLGIQCLKPLGELLLRIIIPLEVHLANIHSTVEVILQLPAVLLETYVSI
jgi:hypothetical protein